MKTMISVEKKERCKSSGCPNAGKNLASCKKCAGPVIWKDENGHSHGKPRSCHNCPNNGLNLPVCWAACPGPTTKCQYDGQSMVFVDSTEDPDSFIAQKQSQPIDALGDSVIDAIESEPDDSRHAYDSTVTAKLSNETETACKVIFSTIMSLEETNFRIFYWLYRGVNPANIASKIGISKQAVCIRKDRMARNNRWMRYFVKSMGLKESAGGGSNRGRFRNSNVIQPDLFVDSVMQELQRDTLRSKLSNCQALCS